MGKCQELFKYYNSNIVLNVEFSQLEMLPQDEFCWTLCLLAVLVRDLLTGCSSSAP